MTTSNKFEDRCMGLFLSTAIGDAKGIPYEIMSREEILKKIKQKQVHHDDNNKGGKDLDDDDDDDGVIFAKVENHPFIPKTFSPGMFSDDTQLTIAMAKGIINGNDSINFNEIAKEHINSYKETTIGWGSSTRNGIKRLLDGTHTYADSGFEDATGNGVLMKLAPLSLYYSQRDMKWEDKMGQIETITRMTHNNNMCVAMACIHGITVEKIFRKIKQHEVEHNSNVVFLSKVSERIAFLEQMIEDAQMIEKRYSIVNEDIKLSKRLCTYLECLKHNEMIEDSLIIQVSKGGNSHSVNSLSMVYGVLLKRNSPNFKTIIKAALMGGDTDSNAAMVGAIIGGIFGTSIIPKEYLQQLDKVEEIKSVALQFSKVLASVPA